MDSWGKVKIFKFYRPWTHSSSHQQFWKSRNCTTLLNMQWQPVLLKGFWLAQFASGQNIAHIQQCLLRLRERHFLAFTLPHYPFSIEERMKKNNTNFHQSSSHYAFNVCFPDACTQADRKLQKNTRNVSFLEFLLTVFSFLQSADTCLF